MKMKYLDNKIKRKLRARLTEDIDRERVDTRWIPHLIEANKYEGVCTVECCEGHNRFHVMNYRGYVSFMFDYKRQRKFRSLIPWLLSTYPVATIRTMYSKSNLGEEYGQRFWGDEYATLNEVVFERYGFQDFVQKVFYPLLEKLSVS